MKEVGPHRGGRRATNERDLMGKIQQLLALN